MARIYQARERKSDGRFDMTVSSDEEGWAHAIGYCGGWPGDTPPSDTVLRSIWGNGANDGKLAWEKYLASIAPHREKYHSGGHATRAEADECYRQHRLDNDLRLDGMDEGRQEKCLVCGEWTQRRAYLTAELPREWVLCDAHCTREHVDANWKARRG